MPQRCCLDLPIPPAFLTANVAGSVRSERHQVSQKQPNQCPSSPGSPKTLSGDATPLQHVGLGLESEHLEIANCKADSRLHNQPRHPRLSSLLIECRLHFLALSTKGDVWIFGFHRLRRAPPTTPMSTLPERQLAAEKSRCSPYTPQCMRKWMRQWVVEG